MSAVVLSVLLLLGAGEPTADLNDRAFWEVQIELTDEAARSLTSEPRKAVNGRVQFEDKRFEARLKLKGHGSFQGLDAKPSFTLQFDKAVTGLAPFGGSKIHLNNSVEDASYLKEKIGAELFRWAGIAAPRVAHARVSLNERELGLYVLKEGFSEEFMQRNFGNVRGTIYDSDSSNQREGVEQMDVDAGDDNAPGRTRLKELWSAASEPELNKRFERLEKVLDVEAFLKFMAMEVMVCHWDGYAMSENNFRIYAPEDGKIQFLPSGMDQIFAKADLAWKPRFSGRVARAFMETESADEKYEAAFRTLLPQVLNAGAISNRLAEVVSELSPHLSRGELGNIRNGAKEFVAGIEARSDSLRSQLDAREAAVSFVNGLAEINDWEPVGEPEGGRLTQTASNLVIHAGPKTSASWRAKVRLPAGRYQLSSKVETHDVVPLPFGNRQGASLRVVGKNTQSKSVTGTNSEVLECEFEVSGDKAVVLICELRAAGGQVRFGKPVRLSRMAVK
jgi:spore coat protein H